jgi:hypothetical protein
MKRELEEYVQKFKSCKATKMLGPKSRALMEITTMANYPFEKCCMYIVGPLHKLKRGLQTNHDIIKQKFIAAKQEIKMHLDKRAKEVQLSVGDKVESEQRGKLKKFTSQ